MLIKGKVDQSAKYAMTNDVAEEAGRGKALDIMLINLKFFLQMVNSN